MKDFIKEWRRIYNTVHDLGQMLKDSKPTYGYMDEYIEPKIRLSKAMQEEIEISIDKLLKESDSHLDKSGIKCAEPLWLYNLKDPRTWPGHESFKYNHLLKFH